MQLFNQIPKMNSLTAGGVAQPSLEEKKEILKGQVEEFAGLLYSQLVREMREAAKDEEGESLFGGGDTGMFMHIYDQQVGKVFAAQAGSGLKETLYRQLSSQLDTQNAKGDNQ